jgi:hypothetical protein
MAKRAHSTTASGIPASPTGLRSGKPEPIDEAVLASWPRRYGLRVTGNCMAPTAPDGCSVIVDKKSPLEVGELVVLWFRPEHVRGGGQQAQLKRLVTAPPRHLRFPHKDHPESEVAPIVIVETDSTNKRYFVKCRDLLALHRCEGPMEAQNG